MENTKQFQDRTNLRQALIDDEEILFEQQLSSLTEEERERFNHSLMDQSAEEDGI